MYEVKEYKFEKDKCWFKSNCENYNNENICNCACRIYAQYYYLVNLANIPPFMQYSENQILDNPGEDIEKYKRLNEIKDNIETWVKKGSNLYLCSKFCGNGKTTWAIKLMSKYFSKIWPGNGLTCRGLFINVDEFLMQKQHNISAKDYRFREMEKLITQVDLVIWDDIGCTQLSEYQHSILFPLINSRISNRKSNIFTSNMGSGLGKNIGDRLADRISNTSEIIVFKNPSQRKPIRWEDGL